MQSAMSMQYGAGKKSEASSPLEEKQELLDCNSSESHLAFHKHHGYMTLFYHRNIWNHLNVHANHFSAFAVIDPLVMRVWFSWMFALRRVCRSSKSVTVTWALKNLQNDIGHPDSTERRCVASMETSRSVIQTGSLTPMLLPSVQQLLCQLPTPAHASQPRRSLRRTDHKTVWSLNTWTERSPRPRQHNRRLPDSTALVLKWNHHFSRFLSENTDHHRRQPPCLIFPEKQYSFRFIYFISKSKCSC